MAVLVIHWLMTWNSVHENGVSADAHYRSLFVQVWLDSISRQRDDQDNERENNENAYGLVYQFHNGIILG